MYRQFHNERTSRVQNYNLAHAMKQEVETRVRKGSGERKKIERYSILF